MVAFWILDPLYNALGGILSAYYAVIPHYGVAIILLTATVSLIRMPLVSKQVKSQQEMQRIQPEIKRIQAKFKSDPQKRNEELMRVYKEHDVNPLASCLPLLLQMPLFIVLYRLILDLAHDPPKHLPQPSRLFNSLVDDMGDMPAFGMDLADRASDMTGGGVVAVGILIVLVVATGFYQTRQMQARLPKESMNTQMAMVGKVMPVMFGVISFTIPAGVVLYFLISNMWQIGQQAYMYRHGPPGGTPPKGKEITDAPAGDDGEGPGAGGKAGGGKAGGGSGSGRSGGKGAPAKGAQAKGTPGKGAQAKGTQGKGGQRRGGPAKAGPGSQNKGAGRGTGGRSGKNRPQAPGRYGGSGRSSGRVTPPKNRADGGSRGKRGDGRKDV